MCSVRFTADHLLNEMFSSSTFALSFKTWPLSVPQLKDYNTSVQMQYLFKWVKKGRIADLEGKSWKLWCCEELDHTAEPDISIISADRCVSGQRAAENQSERDESRGVPRWNQRPIKNMAAYWQHMTVSHEDSCVFPLCVSAFVPSWTHRRAAANIWQR